MRHPIFYSAVFAIIRNPEGKILFSRRHNTGHLDGYLSLPAGHIESDESATKAMIRELSEEVGIEADDLKMAIAQQSTNITDKKTYYNFYFEIHTYTGIIENKEEGKCSELIFLSLDDLRSEKIVPYVLDALIRWKNGESFSEITWS